MCRDDNQPIEVPLNLQPLPEGGYVVTSPILPELQSRGATPEEALRKAHTDLPAVLNSYEEQGKPLPPQFR
jgi:antitoxin HicB